MARSRAAAGSRLATAVVCAAFDDATDTAVLAARDVVTAAGVRLATRPRHRPHLTLAAVRVHPDQLAGVVDLARTVAAETAPIPFVFDHVGTFGRAGALWLGPADDQDLRTLQRSVYTAVAAGPWPVAFGGRSDPASWVPHCSLAVRLDAVTLELERARAAVADGFTPVAAAVVGLAVVLVGGAGDVGLVPLAAGQPAAGAFAAPSPWSK